MTKPATYMARAVLVDRIRRFKEQPREYFDPEEIKARAESMKAVGQETPVTVEPVTGDPDHDYELIDGESRWRSAKVAGIKMLNVLVRSVPYDSVNAKHLSALVANFNRSEHTPMEISNALYRQVRSGMLQYQLATAIGKPEMWVSNYLSLQRLHDEVKKLLDPRLPERLQLTVSAAIRLAKIPYYQQLEVLEKARRSDGRITVVNIESAMEGVRRIKPRHTRPSKRKAMVASALRSIGAAGLKLGRVSPQEALEIFNELKAAGEIPDIASVEELIAVLGVMPTSIAFDDVPMLDDKSTEEDRQRLWEYWAAKAKSEDTLFISIAYPPRKNHPRWVPTKWHKELK